MASRVSSVALVALFLVAFAPRVQADPGAFLVSRSSNLRAGPSSTTALVRHLDVGEVLEAPRDSVENGYRWITTDAGEIGWVWKANIDSVASEDEEATAPATGTSNAAAAISDTWDKPAPNHSTFTCADGTNCGPTGTTGDAVTNLRKDRTDTPESHNIAVHPVSFAAIDGLPDPHAPRSRANWHPADLQSIAPFEGAAIQLQGFLVAFKPQTGSTGEACNCRKHVATDVDVHMALVQNAGQGEGDAIVVETSPRIRKHHPDWTKAVLQPLVDSSTPVRISGWLMFDPEHRAMIGQFRKSMWEIHPITKIEVFANNTWKPLN
jgi:hypothetical protein